MTRPFAQVIAEALTKRGWTLRQFQQKTKMPLSTVGNMVTGERRVTLPRLMQVLNALDPEPAEARELIRAALADHKAEAILAYFTN